MFSSCTQPPASGGELPREPRRFPRTQEHGCLLFLPCASRIWMPCIHPSHIPLAQKQEDEFCQIPSKEPQTVWGGFVQTLPCSTSMGVLVSWGCYNKRPQTWWFKTIEIYSLRVLEAKSLQLVSLSQNQGVSRATCPLEVLGVCVRRRQGLFLASSSF